MIYVGYLVISGAAGSYLWQQSGLVGAIGRLKWVLVVLWWLLCGGSAYLCVEKFGGGILSVVYFIVTLLLMAFAVIDYQTMTVPFDLLIVGGVLGLVLLGVNPNVVWYKNLFVALVMALVLWGIGRVSRGGVGLGDVWLVALIALFLGWEQAFVVLLLGLVLSGLVSGVLLISKKVTKTTMIPFVPFLAVVQFGLLLI